MEQQKWTPQTLVEKLKENVIGQDRYLKDLCTSVWMHSLNKDAEERLGHSVDGVKLNMLVLGKSGTGKTFAIQTLAKLLDMNLVMEDSSVFTGAGWKGREVTSIVKDILQSAGEKRVKAEYSIVILDEIDKMLVDSARTGSFSAWSNFLKLIEGTEVEHTDGQNVYRMNTEKVLFICLGAFDGLDEIIKKRMRAGKEIGFCAKTKEIPQSDIFQYAEKEDLISYGINPQFLGRMAMITATNELKEEDYIRILTESKSSVISRLNTVFLAGMGVKASISKKAAQYMAKRAVKEQTGGRALFSEVTESFREGMYQIAGRKDVKELRLRYSTTDGLKMQFVKGTREKLPLSYKAMTELFTQDSWQSVPMEIARYGCTISGTYQYVEELVETIEMETRRLSREYTYRQIRASMYLIMSAVVCVMTDDVPQTMYEVANQVYSLVSYPPEFNTENKKMDNYATLYWKCWEYEENVESSRDLAIYIIKEYCEQRMWMEEKYSITVS